MRTFIVGFGRSGKGLHLPVLRGLRNGDPDTVPWSPEPPLVWDVRDIRQEAVQSGLVPVDSPEEAARITDPARTVVHVCTPPAERLHVLTRLVALGYTRMLVEKPLAADTGSLDAIDALVREHGVAMRVISPWLSSTLTGGLHELITGGTLGTLRSLRFRQLKPRWTRTLDGFGHPTVFDVELPHSVGVALWLAGDGQLVDAEWEDLRLGERNVPRMGRGRIVLQHDSGVQSEFFSDLTAPTRERSVAVRCAGGDVLGHYPVSEADHYAQWTVRQGIGPAERSVAWDDALTAFLRDAYRDFAEERPAPSGADDYAIGVRVVELLQDAKLLAGAQTTTPGASAPVAVPARPEQTTKAAAHDV
jgi:predicted dehydrogenase